MEIKKKEEVLSFFFFFLYREESILFKGNNRVVPHRYLFHVLFLFIRRSNINYENSKFLEDYCLVILAGGSLFYSP